MAMASIMFSSASQVFCTELDPLRCISSYFWRNVPSWIYGKSRPVLEKYASISLRTSESAGRLKALLPSTLKRAASELPDWSPRWLVLSEFDRDALLDARTMSPSRTRDGASEACCMFMSDGKRPAVGDMRASAGPRCLMKAILDEGPKKAASSSSAKLREPMPSVAPSASSLWCSYWKVIADDGVTRESDATVSESSRCC